MRHVLFSLLLVVVLSGTCGATDVKLTWNQCSAIDPLTNEEVISGYYVGTTLDQWSDGQITDVEGNGITSLTVTNLGPGRWYFKVWTHDQWGNRNDYAAWSQIDLAGGPFPPSKAWRIR